jgi:hypothetical protein
MFLSKRYSRSLARLTLVSLLTLPLSSAFAADFPVGSYAAEGHTLTLALDGNGQFRVTEKEVVQVSGRYSVKGDQIELTDTDGPWACTKAGEQTGTYHWKMGKSVLTLSKVADQCEDRVGSLVKVRWKQQV